MRFHVYRTSDDDHRAQEDGPPCARAYWDAEYRLTENCFLRSPGQQLTEAAERYIEKRHHEWLSEGENHREVKGMHVRERKVGGWMLDIETPDDLIALAETNDTYTDGREVIVGTLYGNPYIEIYDAYRE